MPNQNRKNPLEIFISDLGDVSMLDDYSFAYLYPGHFFDFTDDLRKEIVANLKLLSDSKFDAYIKYVQFEINNAYRYDPTVCIIDRWIKQFNLIEEDFPFEFNEEVAFLTTSFRNDDTLDSEVQKKVRSIQLEFHWYAVFLEVKKINDFIDEFMVGKTSTNPFQSLPKSSTEIKPTKKMADKWYALLYLLELEVKGLSVPINSEGSFIKIELEKIGKQRNGKSGQGFYRSVLNIKPVINDKNKLQKMFVPNWKEEIILLSNRDKTIIDYLETH
jgi:hypothetical protein